MKSTKNVNDFITLKSDKIIDISNMSSDNVNKTTDDGKDTSSISTYNHSVEKNHGSNLSDFEHLGPEKVNLVGGHIN